MNIDILIKYPDIIDRTERALLQILDEEYSGNVLTHLYTERSFVRNSTWILAASSIGILPLEMIK